MEVRVPDLGDFKDVAVIDVLVKPGDTIAVDTPLVTLESDKAAMDVPSTVSGVVEKVHAEKGGTAQRRRSDRHGEGRVAPAGAAPHARRAPQTNSAAAAAPAAAPAARAAAAGPRGAGTQQPRWRPARQDGAALPARRADLVPHRPGAHR